MDIPGDPTPQEQQVVYEQLRQRTVEMWGEERASGLEPSLRSVSLAVARLEKVRFSRSDAPGFYLHDLAPGEVL